MSTTFDDFFSAKPQLQEPKKPVLEFRPKVSKGQGGVYKALIRFLPNPNDAAKSIIQKYVCWLPDPANPSSKRPIDCPSSIGQPDQLQNTFFALRNSNNAVLQTNSKFFSRKQQFTSLVQIIQCEHEPQLVNKILTWTYGIKVYEKIEAELNPPIGDPVNPFHPIYGRPFAVQIKEVSGYTNYDSCQFVNIDVKQSGLRLVQTDPVTGQSNITVVTPELTATPEGGAYVINYLKENAPDLTPYEFHPWTSEDQEYVNRCIQIYMNPNASQAASAASMNPGAAVMPQQPTYAQAAAQPTIQQPSAPAMAAPMGFGMPASPAPQMGMSQSAIAGMDPRGFQPVTVPSGLDSVLDSAMPSMPPTTAAPAQTLDSVLGDQFNGGFDPTQTML